MGARPTPRPEFSIEHVATGDVDALVVRGEVDMVTAPSLVQAASPLMHRQRAIVLDLDGVSFIDSSGLAALLMIQRTVAAAGSAMALANPSTQLLRLLSLSGLEGRFEVVARPLATG
jgi:anti-sigma B factor antagonist